MLLLSDYYAFYGSCACSAFLGSYLIDSKFFCFDLLAGGSPAATHFSLLRQRNVSKRKATRLSGSLCFALGNLRCPGKTGQSGNEIQKAEQPNNHRARGLVSNATNSIANCAALSCTNGTFDAQMRVPASESVSVPASPVLTGPVLGKESRIRAARCLSKASLRRPPFFRGSAGCPKRSAGTQTAGSPFFCLLFFGEAKKSE